MGLGLPAVGLSVSASSRPCGTYACVLYVPVCHLVITPCRCFVKAMWKAVRGRLGLKKIVFKVTEKKGDGKKSVEAAADGLLAQSKGSGLSDAEVGP